MLRMDGFRYHDAQSYAEALGVFSTNEGAMYVAGGTDLLPNTKHGLFRPKVLVGLGGIAGYIRDQGDTIGIGATTKLQAIADHPLVQTMLDPLAQAAAVVAGPQIRNMGTLGGNVLLDTRCVYYNQTEAWRKALGYCLKAEGDWCHVIGGPKTCVAAQSSDTVPVLLALGARLRLLNPSGEREVAIRDVYRFDGMDHLSIQKGELLTEIVVPKPAAGVRGSYQKLRTRDSIDFPQLGLAVCGSFDGVVPLALDIVVGAVNPQPKAIRGLDAFLGAPMDEAAIDTICDLVYKQTRPQASVHGDAAWRRQMAVVFTRRALVNLRTRRSA